MSDGTVVQDTPVSSETLLLIGPILIGALVSYCLFGVSIVQLYIYHMSFPKDSKIIKASVYSIFILDTFQSVIVAVFSWRALCFGWGRPSILPYPGWSLATVPALSGIVSAWVQIFYAWRIYLLNGKRRFIPGVIVVFSLAQACGSIAITAGFVQLKNVAKLHLVKMYARTIVWLGGAVFTDVIISLSMLYFLYNAKSTSFGKTQAMINRLIRLTIETGLVTATTAAVELILFQAFQETNLHLCVALSLCKVYSNALMTSLNSRAVSGARGTTLVASGHSQWNSAVSPRRIDAFPGAAVIHVTTTTDSYNAGQSDSAGDKTDITIDSVEMADRTKKPTSDNCSF